MTGSLASINIRFSADLKQFSSEMQTVVRDMKSVGAKLSDVGRGMSTYITLPLLAGGAAAVKFASDYNESLNKVEVAFGPASESVKSFAKDSLKSFGIAEGSALDAAATYGDMATSMGLTQNAASQMATSLVGLAGDLASFKNIGIEQANTALAGVFTGETESLKKLGIVMTEANLQSFALSKGIKTQVKDMDQAAKVNLRYAYIMANTTNAQGDFERTGGGAANQMRIFQESLKELAAQFGQVILPFFTKVITGVNDIIKGFSELSTTTKTTILIFAGVAAAIGPLLTGLGSLITFIPNLIIQFSALKAVILANPYIAATVAIAALGAAIYAYVSSANSAVSSQKALNDAINKGNESAASEVGTLDRLYASATNVNGSIDERKKSVDELQSMFPAYFGNLKDEAILNGEVSKTYKQLREDIFNKARAMAIENELQTRANERIKTENRLRQDIAATEAEIARIRKGADVVVLQEANAMEKTAQVTIKKSDLLAAQNRLLDIQKDKLSRYYNYALGQDKILLDAKTDYLSKTGKLEENEILKLEQIKIGTDAIKDSVDGLAPGTIAFYEAQISALKKVQTEQALSNEEWLNYQSNIDAIQKKIDALTNTKIKLPKPPNPTNEEVFQEVAHFSLQDLNDQKSYLEQLREQFSTTSDEYIAFSDRINNVQVKINEIEGVEEAKLALTETGEEMSNFIANATTFNEGLTSIMQSVGQTFAEGFGEMLGQSIAGGVSIQSVWTLMITALADMAIQVGKLAIGIGISVGGIKKALTSLNPVVAIAAGVALVALGTFAKSALADIAGGSGAPAFANGGVVPGTSLYGDKILARVNSGELILNQKQQANLWGMMNSSGQGINVNLEGGFRLAGSDLELVIERAINKNSRKR